LLVSEGSVRVAGDGPALLLQQGEAAFVPASEGSLTLSEKGRLFRARVPD
jgi:mannose-6-phosphate isomerase class I